MTMQPLETAMPVKWVAWASRVEPAPMLCEVARKALCLHPFSELGLVGDLVTVWKHHGGQGCDPEATPGEVRAVLQRKCIQTMTLAELPPVDAEVATRMMTIARNFATDGNTYKATGDRLIHAFIECRLPVADLAAIPSNQPPYAANAKLDTAEATIKEVSAPPPVNRPSAALTGLRADYRAQPGRYTRSV